VIDVEHPDFFKRLDALVLTNAKLAELSKAGSSVFQKAPVIASFAFQLLVIFFMKPVQGGSYELNDDSQLAY